MSTTIPARALAPKRERGRTRVAAILDAGGAVFAEKGYDAATMTEIAARANAAIGSLYRFFPTKEVLADALLDRYWDRLSAALDDVAERAPRLSPGALADALVDLMLGLQSDRAAVVALIDARGDGADKRAALRGAIRARIASILGAAIETLSPAAAHRMAAVLLHVLKGARALAEEDSKSGDLVAEIRALLRLYLSQASSTRAADYGA